MRIREQATVAGHPAVSAFVATAISMERWKTFKSHVQTLNRAAKVIVRNAYQLLQHVKHLVIEPFSY